MGAELGRISGPLLAANLLRRGADLSFRNFDADPDILYLDVNSGRIGINTSTPSRELTVNGTTTTTNLLVDTQATLGDLTFLTHRIQNAAGLINVVPNQLTDPTVVINELRSDNLKLSNRTITTLTANDNINLVADGTGRVVFNTVNVNVNGNLHATGNITWEGNIIIGDGNTDSVTFDSDITSDIVPDQHNFYELGSATRNLRWKTNYVGTLTANHINLSTLSVNSIDLLVTQGNTLYVSANGDDTYYGDHLHATFKTLKHALSVAQSGDQIFIFPGTYYEELPLLVPQGVSIIGESLRSVTITPTPLTNGNDVFLLNGETTVENITVKNFLYDSINDIGYAFRFALGMKTTSRSPYIRNCSLISYNTNGTSGRGALIDGSVVDPDSYEAAMLFHSVTMILVESEAVTATNGARVEWLNSFTYYAHRGIHLTRGTLGFASLGVRFGAEMRSINSANVYGTYGAVADGLDTLGYLIGHNFGYIGTGSDSNNDANLSLQSQEVVQINGGVIYFDSMDHKGDYRVGEIFYVNQQTGQVSFNAQSINLSASGNITIDGPTGQIILDATKVQVSNIRIYDNNIISLIGPVNFSAQSGTTTLNTTVNVTGNTNVTGDTIVKGNVFLGNNPLDLITITPNLTQDIIPGANNTYNLGAKTPTAKVWNTAYFTTLDVDGITQITNNTISTLTSDNDLRFVAAGTGIIHVSGTDVQVDNNLTTVGTVTVNGATSLQDTETVGTITLVGNIGQTGDTYITGLFDNHNIILTGTHSYIQVPDIKIQDNNISATASNSDLNLVGTGAGSVTIDSKLKIADNVITNIWPSATTNNQKSIIFSPNGTGNVVVDSVTYLKTPVGNDTNRLLSTAGEIRFNTAISSYEGYLSTGTESFFNVYSTDKKTYVTPELTIGNNDNILRFTVNNVVKGTIDSTKVFSSVMQVGNFVFSNNTINNPVTNSDSIFNGAGTGSVNANGLLFKDGSITNTQDSAITLVSTGTGYVKFSGTGAVVLPFGPTGDRRLTPEQGETRFNSTLNYMEVYTGTSWIPAVGTLGAAPLADVLDIMDIYSLILG
jgi:hypothetical protein